MPRKKDGYSAARKQIGEESPDSIEQGARCKPRRVTASKSNSDELSGVR